MADPITITITVQIPMGTRLDAAVLLTLEAAAKAMSPHGANSHQIARAARWLSESYDKEAPRHG